MKPALVILIVALVSVAFAQDCNNCGGCLICTFVQDGFFWTDCATTSYIYKMPAGSTFYTYVQGSQHCETCSSDRTNAADPDFDGTREWGVWGTVAYSDFSYAACQTATDEQLRELYAKTNRSSPMPVKPVETARTPVPTQPAAPVPTPRTPLPTPPPKKVAIDTVPASATVGNGTTGCTPPGTYTPNQEAYLRNNEMGAYCGTMEPNRDIFKVQSTDGTCFWCYGVASGPVCAGVNCAPACPCCGYVECAKLTAIEYMATKYNFESNAFSDDG